jgi:hypothetical protein
MADHKSYMHPSFPSSKNNEHGAHLNHEHDMTHEDAGIRDRTEPHSVDGAAAPSFMSGHGN